MKRALIACEESQRVCTAFRARGWDAYSCDIQNPSGGHPEWHIKGDVTQILSPRGHLCTGYYIIFNTMDGHYHEVEKWDLIIAHPPCTFLTVTGNRWFNIERYGEKAIERVKNRNKAARFFMTFINAPCEHIAVENPIGYMSRSYHKPDQIVQPYWFGDPIRKATCLWLKGLPKLSPTDIVRPDIYYFKTANGKIKSDNWARSWSPKDRLSRHRSKTPLGLASAMAEQWGSFIEKTVI